MVNPCSSSMTARTLTRSALEMCWQDPGAADSLKADAPAACASALACKTAGQLSLTSVPSALTKYKVCRMPTVSLLQLSLKG